GPGEGGPVPGADDGAAGGGRPLAGAPARPRWVPPGHLLRSGGGPLDRRPGGPPRVDAIALFPLAFLMLVMSKVHGLTKNGLTSAYAPATEGLVRANGRLGRVAVAGGM